MNGFEKVFKSIKGRSTLKSMKNLYMQDVLRCVRNATQCMCGLEGDTSVSRGVHRLKVT